jgi:branched-chain amino acid transport system permease protein
VFTLLRNFLITAGAGIVLFGLTYAVEPFRDYQLATVAAYLCATAGLTVLIGLNGQVSLGHGALMAVGAYTVALVQNAFADANHYAQWTIVVSLLLGIVAALVAGVVIGLAAARLRGPYLAGVTLAVAVVVPAFATVFSGTFKGDQGLSVAVPPPPEALGLDFPVERWQAWLALVAALLVMLLLANLAGSRYGRMFRAVRDNEVAARLAGIHVARTQVLAFVVSAACAGLAGGMFAILSQSVSPSAFSLTLSLYLLLAVVLGGLGSLAGAVWGAVALVLLPELLSSLTNAMDLSPAAAQRLEGNLPLAIFGLTLIVVMIGAPSGIQGAINRLTRRIRKPQESRLTKGGATT